MVCTSLLSESMKAYIYFLRNDRNMPVVDVMTKTGVSRTSIYRIAGQKIKPKVSLTSKKGTGGRPRKLTTRDERNILRTIQTLRAEEGNFSSKRIMERAGIEPGVVSDRTIRRCLNRHGYHSLQARKKGLMSKTDLKKRVAFARYVLKKYKEDVWTSKVAFYLDGVSFYYKRNPCDQARAPRGRIWRLKSEGLKQGCTSKGSKTGSGGKVLKLMVAISHGRGVILCHQYEKLDGPGFQQFVLNKFDHMFSKAGKRGPRLFVQDNDPSQNCCLVKRALKRKNAKQLKIPPRSPDLNPIENIFNSVKKILRQDAIAKNITTETFQEFAERVINTMYTFPRAEIDKTIESMNRRIRSVIACKGERLKY